MARLEEAWNQSHMTGRALTLLQILSTGQRQALTDGNRASCKVSTGVSALARLTLFRNLEKTFAKLASIV